MKKINFFFLVFVFFHSNVFASNNIEFDKWKKEWCKNNEIKYVNSKIDVFDEFEKFKVVGITNPKTNPCTDSKSVNILMIYFFIEDWPLLKTFVIDLLLILLW